MFFTYLIATEAKVNEKLRIILSAGFASFFLFQSLSAEPQLSFWQQFISFGYWVIGLLG